MQLSTYSLPLFNTGWSSSSSSSSSESAAEACVDGTGRILKVVAKNERRSRKSCILEEKGESKEPISSCAFLQRKSGEKNDERRRERTRLLSILPNGPCRRPHFQAP